jgi:hypothetical protein
VICPQHDLECEPIVIFPTAENGLREVWHFDFCRRCFDDNAGLYRELFRSAPWRR